MGELSLLDLECILMEREKLSVEKNGKKIKVDSNEIWEEILKVNSEEIWGEIHKNKIIKAKFFGEDTVCIKLKDFDLIIFL